jgi:hypothetical protein
VDESCVSISHNQDPIFKDYIILVNGEKYKPFDFIKLLRNSKDGAFGRGIIEDNALILNVAHNTLLFEEILASSGGRKKGFIKSKNKLSEHSLESLKKLVRGLNVSKEESIVVLNEGLDFQEVGRSSVEMQLNENKTVNSAEICKLFGLSIGVINGTANAVEFANAFKTGLMPILRMIECALNRDLLLEKEKPKHYWAFDTKEILKGDIEARFKAYEVGLKSNVLRIDEARFMEDLPPLGVDWINLGLNSVLYDPYTKTFYTPNTNKHSDMNSTPEIGTLENVTSSTEANKQVEQVAGKQLNGAQTVSLINVISQYTAGALNLGQAVNIVSVSIGVSREEAKRIIEGLE